MAAGRHLNRPSRLQCEPSCDKSATPEEHKCCRGEHPCRCRDHHSMSRSISGGFCARDWRPSPTRWRWSPQRAGTPGASWTARATGWPRTCSSSASRRGDRVASLMPNRDALIVHYLACFKAGLVATPLNYRYQPPEIDHALEVSGASILLAHAERDEDLRRASSLGDFPWAGSATAPATGRPPSFEELMSATPRQRDAPARRPRPTRRSSFSRPAAPANRRA